MGDDLGPPSHKTTHCCIITRPFHFQPTPVRLTHSWHVCCRLFHTKSPRSIGTVGGTRGYFLFKFGFQHMASLFCLRVSVAGWFWLPAFSAVRDSDNQCHLLFRRNEVGCCSQMILPPSQFTLVSNTGPTLQTVPRTASSSGWSCCWLLYSLATFLAALRDHGAGRQCHDIDSSY